MENVFSKFPPRPVGILRKMELSLTSLMQNRYLCLSQQTWPQTHFSPWINRKASVLPPSLTGNTLPFFGIFWLKFSKCFTNINEIVRTEGGKLRHRACLALLEESWGETSSILISISFLAPYREPQAKRGAHSWPGALPYHSPFQVCDAGTWISPISLWHLRAFPQCDIQWQYIVLIFMLS